ncbi:flagellar hook-length control protein FliK [Halorhodospira halochloris]|uniref:flagellar hook-length control protein FliK n=1 Tax=Halorhodospira halochloris TaxID=1052 RepID=UPI001EE7B68E|nr:flagellar hook-length control protein FliK [Halorhodospira halochloris]MCG5548618.1 flagellar hook-length control protein FliK [Halorhodospira halochloris]
MVGLNQIQICFPQMTGRLPLTFSLGQRFIANVRKSPHGLVLVFGENRLPARAETAVADGDRLLLEVADIRQDLILRVVEHFGQRPALQQTLRQTIPRQGSVKQLIKSMASNLGTYDVAQSNFISSLPTLHSLQHPGSFSQAFYNSGLFCEHRIASTRTPEDLAKDHKAQLLRWIRAMRSDTGSNSSTNIRTSTRRATQAPSLEATPSQQDPILNSAEAFLARITALQTRLALNQQADWSLEIPLRDDNGLGSASLRIRWSSAETTQHTNETDSNEIQRVFTVDASLDLPAAAPMYVALLLQGKSIDCAWWSTCAKTVAALQARIPQLRQKLAEQGLDQQRINVQQGWPNQDQTAPAVEIPAGMIHEQA